MRNKKKSHSFTILPEQTHQRIDYFLSRQDLNLSRSRIHKLLETQQVTVNGLPIRKASYLLHPKDLITITLPEPEKSKILPEDIPLDIVYEDESIIVVNKPAGMVVHPAAGNYTGTMVNALLHHCRFLSGIGGVTRPGIVHRLDKDTSGLLVVAKTDSAHLNLSEQIKARTVKKIYRALVYGIPTPAEGHIKTYIGRHRADRKKMSTTTKKGRLAITYYKVEENFSDYALLQILLQTGRTHQIRVHLSSIKHPVIGDSVYGYRRLPPYTKRYPQVHQAITQLKRHVLHAHVLGLVHPEQKKYLEFTAPLPDKFTHLLDLLRKIKE